MRARSLPRGSPGSTEGGSVFTPPSQCLGRSSGPPRENGLAGETKRKEAWQALSAWPSDTTAAQEPALKATGVPQGAAHMQPPSGENLPSED